MKRTIGASSTIRPECWTAPLVTLQFLRRPGENEFAESANGQGGECSPPSLTLRVSYGETDFA
jgi:hypothetical protein